MKAKTLRQLIESSGMTQTDALALFNEGHHSPLSLSQWQAYIALPGSSRAQICPEVVQERMELLLHGEQLSAWVEGHGSSERIKVTLRRPAMGKHRKVSIEITRSGVRMEAWHASEVSGVASAIARLIRAWL